MKDDDLIKGYENKGEDRADECATKLQEGKADEEGTDLIEILGGESAQEERKEDKAERSTVADIEGKRFDPFETFAVLALIDIAPRVKTMRLKNGPLFFHLVKPVTLTGSGKRARIKLDDPCTISAEHAAIVFKEGQFHIYPQEGSILVDGKKVLKEGEVLNNGSQIEIGSARLIFLRT